MNVSNLVYSSNDPGNSLKRALEKEEPPPNPKRRAITAVGVENIPSIQGDELESLKTIASILQPGVEISIPAIEYSEKLDSPLLKKTLKIHSLIQNISPEFCRLNHSQIFATCISALKQPRTEKLSYFQKKPSCNIPCSFFTLNDFIVITMGKVSESDHTRGATKRMQRGCLIDLAHESVERVALLRNRFREESRSMTHIPQNEIVISQILSGNSSYPRTYLTGFYQKVKKIGDCEVACNHQMIVEEIFQMSLVNLTFSTLIIKQKELEIQQLINIAEQLLTALVHFHLKGYAHGDIKPGNIFTSYLADGSIKTVLGDFGRSFERRYRPFGNKLFTYGTYKYSAPDFLTKAQSSMKVDFMKVDTYAMGLTLFKLVRPASEITWEHDLNEVMIQLRNKHRKEEAKGLIDEWALPAVKERAKELKDQINQIKTQMQVISRRINGIAAKENKSPREALEEIIYGLLQVDVKKRWTPLKALEKLRELKLALVHHRI